MSRMSALTTFRLIGSPTNPGWPYWRPCSDCLSAERDMPTGDVGSGAADEVCWWAKTPVAARQTSERTSVVLLMADLTRGSKDIVPSLAKFRKRAATHYARLPGQISARHTNTARFWFLSKGRQCSRS